MLPHSEGHHDIVQYLVNEGADKDMGNAFGHTPLHAASQEGNHNVVQCLVIEGAQVNKATQYGQTPLLAASFHGHLNIVEVSDFSKEQIKTFC